ncbi:manganese efflux pump MntP [Desulfotalea psychrophila]|uniref:Manganese exporter MntP n=1 Tax=Desulfotalea psychrophila (strain LSv54 / DSM 12343) TaxID=177439 RepID=MNTP_DESPS|nr:manganese efflux pump MntP family protein [Desulfotalea psychrophila]Q6APV5.1 RecName: Full=Putative manganese efflux pump MntP [Desulfotalea psychrophila LSv54]CAG35619.1 conserved hypothetical membrane protein [Desulfotalea psychrophila LSv54]
MSTTYLLGLAVALAMDAFAVAIAVGIGLKRIRFRQAFRLSYHFGLFQALMPIIGWALGTGIRQFTQSYAHWIAFTLLALVGANMIREALSDDEEEPGEKDPTRGLRLIILSLATSIDALAVGLSLSMLEVSIWYPALIIGLVAGAFTLFGMLLGQRIAKLQRFSSYAEVLGGIILWAIGLNILYDNGVFSPFL